ncbi:MAG TPA: YafY family protein [Bacteroidia bacterium]
MNRIERISAILIQLQSKKIVKAQEIAERFGISLRSVYRDIRSLEESGVPVVGEAGVGYSLMEGYRLPPVQFSIEEATAFVTAEKMIEKFTDSGLDESYKSAMYKVKATLRNVEKNYLETIEENIVVLKNPYLPDKKNENNFLQTSIDAISGKRAMNMSYFANHSQETSSRLIEPVGVFYQTGRWYLIAWCHLRKDYRTFRNDRIRDLQMSGKTFEKQHLSLKSFLKQTAKEEKLYTVILSVDNEATRYMSEQKYYNGFVSEKRGKHTTEMTFLTSKLEGIARWYMMLGDHATIIEPAALKQRVREMLKSIEKKVN